MSSTNRGAERQEDDFYETPAWAVDAVLQRLGPPLAGKWILEPSAGRGAIVRGLLAYGASPYRLAACELDSARYHHLYNQHPEIGHSHGDFADYARTGARYDLIVMNPPFSLAEQHIRLACSLLAPGGTVAALVRLAFLAESQTRAGFRRDLPHDRLELVKRPSFTAEVLSWATDADLLAMVTDKDREKADAMAEKKRAKHMTAEQRLLAVVRGRLQKTDSCAYAWGLFGEGRGGRFWTHEEAA